MTALTWTDVSVRRLSPNTLVAMAAVIVLAATWQLDVPTNSDVSWLLTLGERWASGERPYVDFLEVNPPASIMLYMPAVWIAAKMPIQPETVVVLLVLLGACLSTAFTCFVLKRAGLFDEPAGRWLPPAVFAVLVLLPAGSFAEREHIAVLAALPFFAALAARIVGRPLGLVAALIAGCGAGLALTIKPIFALALIGPLLTLVLRRKASALFATIELYPALLTPALYAAVVPLTFPAFVHDVLPTVLAAYVPVREPWSSIPFAPIGLVFLGLCGIAVLLLLRGSRAEWPLVLVTGALGFHGAFALQGKLWSYQALPGVMLAALAVLWLIASRRRWPDWPTCLGATAFGVLLLAGVDCLNDRPTMGARIPGLEAAVAAVAPHPTLMAITSDISVGHPLVRDVGGRWVGSLPSTWISDDTDILSAGALSDVRRAELKRLSLAEKTLVTRDILTREPDVILVRGARWHRYIDDDPALAAAFRSYRFQGSFERVEVYARNGGDRAR